MFVLLMTWSLFFLFFMIRLPRYYDSCPSFLTSLRPVFTLTPLLFHPSCAQKLSAFLAKSGSPPGCPVGTKRGLKMVENTSKMMLRASKIDQGMAKIITQKIERILKNFSFFRLLQTGLCNVGFLLFWVTSPTARD